MATMTTVVGTPTLPRVNLLPPEIAEARTLKQYRLGAACAVAATAVVIGGLYYQAHGGVASAQSALDASQSKTGALTTQVNALQGVTALKAQVVSAQSTLNAALAPQVLWSHYLQDMSVALAGNYWFTTMSMALTPAVAPGGVAASPLADSSAIASLTLQGKAISQADVAKLLVALGSEKGLSHPTVSSLSEDPSPLVGTSIRLVTFAATSSIDATGKPVPVVATDSTPTTTPTKPAGN
jgi:Tfp pilus assembly protein PilN